MADIPPAQTRPDWAEWFMRLAFVTAERGSCLRKKVGAIIVRDRDKAVISGGYNGAPRGMPDCFEVGCEMRMIGEKESCVRTIHAESNALDRAGPLNEPHTLYCTVIPCRDCALRIIQNGWIHKCVYAEYYESRGSKDTEALFAMRDADTIRLAESKLGRMEEAGWLPVARVELVKMAYTEPEHHLRDLLVEVATQYSPDAAKSLAWKVFVAQHGESHLSGQGARDFDQLCRELCHSLGVTTEPNEV